MANFVPVANLFVTHVTGIARIRGWHIGCIAYYKSSSRGLARQNTEGLTTQTVFDFRLFFNSLEID